MEGTDDPPGGKKRKITPAQQNKLRFHSKYVFIFDGHSNSHSLINSFKGGQRVRVEITNKNIFGVQLDLQDKSIYHYDKTWFRTQTQVYDGDSYSFVLLPGQTKAFEFYRFDYFPMNWTFELGTSISEVALVGVKYCSTWVPGMKYDWRHPRYK